MSTRWSICGFYPVDGADYPDLRDALEKLQLNDAALSFEPETSAALGFGFRCGFLGLLHYEIVQERLEREFLLDLISTAPSVVYRSAADDGQTILLDNPTNMPDVNDIDSMEEPVVTATIMTPKEYRRQHHGALPGTPRHLRQHGLPRCQPRHAALRHAAERDHL